MLYPLKFEKILKEKVWGGYNLKKLNIEIPHGKMIGESWEIAAHSNGMSKVSNGHHAGKTLCELLEMYKEELVGESVYRKYGNKFPLLIKYLDIHDKLSIQVHPGDEYAKKNEGEFGKMESWYVIKASRDEKVILGLADHVTKELFVERVQQEDYEGVFKEIHIEDGDFLNIPPGTVHGNLQGSILVVEIQQNSDSTYRIHDFGRLFNGEKRELHIEKALEVINFKSEHSKQESQTEIKDYGSRTLLTANEYYYMEKLCIFDGKSYSCHLESFSVITVVGGEGTLRTNSENLPIERWDNVLIPANFEFWIEGEVEVIKTWIEE